MVSVVKLLESKKSTLCGECKHNTMRSTKRPLQRAPAVTTLPTVAQHAHSAIRTVRNVQTQGSKDAHLDSGVSPFRGAIQRNDAAAKSHNRARRHKAEA